ncbi:NTP transferase domain-containing protein [Helicobacter sp. 11S02629-2]|uniref:NTP transferase domain-containing protein n=1 Tax=Helicobacter sp. 11S02629-2 TaxID=1476195 RepID=UPI000BA7698F|nr:NTP transferase domain-containing protein [Helicobacter sp. 11S02629-2]PAF41209.1 hypothetical protein BKH40_08500 [Helicobacter sp. 11S02629-2]
MQKLIIQAGGRGTRLEGLTRNKPKCLVPVDNLPIIFHIFKHFPKSEFLIIADYKMDVLKRYLKVFAKDYKYKVIKASDKGTASGIKEALSYYKDDERVVILWCDLILPKSFKLPSEKANFIGISKDFECRWSFKNSLLVKEPSKDQGIAGLFIFKDKSILKELPLSGALVPYLQSKNIDFKELALSGTKEIGTMIAYMDNNKYSLKRWRPFNSLKFENDLVIKEGIDDQGKKIAKDEVAWYKFVKEQGFKYIPEIYKYNPLEMRLIKGQNIYEYDCLTKSQKKEILYKIIKALDSLHHLVPPIKANLEDIKSNYITKTFLRLETIKDLVPFANKEFIRINHRYYKNIFYDKARLEKLLDSMSPMDFRLIHGDCTFSNMMFDTFNMQVTLLDPRGYFGDTKLYGDVDYDWAKLYYSLKGNYDQFNLKKFTLDIKSDDIELSIKPNNWEDMEEYFFDNIPNINRLKIKTLHSIIWLSLTTYAWEDYDSICAAFYNGVIHAGEIL